MKNRKPFLSIYDNDRAEPIGHEKLEHISRIRFIFKIILLSICVFWTSPARSIDLCMSDTELKAYLTEVALYKWNISGKICLLRYPSHIDEWRIPLLNMEKEVISISSKRKGVALSAFRRAYDEKSDDVFRIMIDAATRVTKEYASHATLPQCQGMVDLVRNSSNKMEDIIESEINDYWNLERSRVDKCK